MGDVEALAQQMCANLGGVWAFIRETRKDQYRRNARAALESDLFASLVAAARAEERERWAGEVRGILHDLRRYAPDGDLFDEANPRHVSVGLIAVRLRALLPEDLRPREGA